MEAHLGLKHEDTYLFQYIDPKQKKNFIGMQRKIQYYVSSS